ncbi:MAG: hypothetical protein E7585_04225 [Ruminococcaceae bacterium]|nr:hypothetical protein [Oscillospiraceae bacterium]
MNAEEKKKASSSFRFNVFDAILILLAVLCIVGIWQRGNLQRLFDAGEAMEEYVVTFEVQKLRSTTADLLVQGTEFYLEENGSRISLGTLSVQVAARPATEYLQNSKGETVVARYPEDAYERLQDVTGSLVCRGIVHDGAFLLEGKTHIAINQTIAAFTETADLNICVTGIEKTA